MPDYRPPVPPKKVECKDLDNAIYNVPVEQLKFRPSVYAVIIKEKKILLSRQWDGYDYPGGGLKLGESIENGLKRETFEETGVEIIPRDVIYVKDELFKFKYGKNNFVHSILIYFLCDYKHGSLTNKYMAGYEKEYMGPPVWVSVEQAKSLKFYNQINNQIIIERALKIKRKRDLKRTV